LSFICVVTLELFYVETLLPLQPMTWIFHPNSWHLICQKWPWKSTLNEKCSLLSTTHQLGPHKLVVESISNLEQHTNVHRYPRCIVYCSDLFNINRQESCNIGSFSNGLQLVIHKLSYTPPYRVIPIFFRSVFNP
jgi:hypothetical protein